MATNTITLWLFNQGADLCVCHELLNLFYYQLFECEVQAVLVALGSAQHVSFDSAFDVGQAVVPVEHFGEDIIAGCASLVGDPGVAEVNFQTEDLQSEKKMWKTQWLL